MLQSHKRTCIASKPYVHAYVYTYMCMRIYVYAYTYVRMYMCIGSFKRVLGNKLPVEKLMSCEKS